jgi:hypothetical protein
MWKKKQREREADEYGDYGDYGMPGMGGGIGGGVYVHGGVVAEMAPDAALAATDVMTPPSEQRGEGRASLPTSFV